MKNTKKTIFIILDLWLDVLKTIPEAFPVGILLAILFPTVVVLGLFVIFAVFLLDSVTFFILTFAPIFITSSDHFIAWASFKNISEHSRAPMKASLRIKGEDCPCLIVFPLKGQSYVQIFDRSFLKKTFLRKNQKYPLYQNYKKIGSITIQQLDWGEFESQWEDFKNGKDIFNAYKKPKKIEGCN